MSRPDLLESFRAELRGIEAKDRPAIMERWHYAALAALGEDVNWSDTVRPYKPAFAGRSIRELSALIQASAVPPVDAPRRGRKRGGKNAPKGPNVS